MLLWMVPFKIQYEKLPGLLLSSTDCILSLLSTPFRIPRTIPLHVFKLQLFVQEKSFILIWSVDFCLSLEILWQSAESGVMIEFGELDPYAANHSWIWKLYGKKSRTIWLWNFIASIASLWIFIDVFFLLPLVCTSSKKTTGETKLQRCILVSLTLSITG